MKKGSEKEAKKMEALLKAYIKTLPDIPLEDAWKIVNKAAFSIEQQVISWDKPFTTPRTKFLLGIARNLRKEAEKALGPQPGFGPTKTIEKRV